ncbi:MAG: ABC transporter ATP-binding protein [Spirochaetes bacterium]|nr:ABC transporter ATP-binding protein [Spirochaetota bacterium]
MLSVASLRASYGSLRVLRSVSIHVDTGEIVAIIGANGAGKSTLVRTVTGLVKASAGRVLLDGTDITRMPTERIVANGCVLVPEGRHVFAAMSVRENLMLGGHPLRRKLPARERREAEKSELSRMYSLFPKLLDRQHQLAGTLSGGEQQMLAIGRALMSRPKLLILDEPSTGLAPIVVKDIFRVIKELRDSGMTILIIEQNARAALAIADRGYALETGQVMLEGSAKAVLGNHDIQRAYLGKEYKAKSDLR